MFTGIITYIGKVKDTKSKLKISCSKTILSKLDKGDSIAVDGICLTIATIEKNSFSIDVMPQTFNHTNIQYIKINNFVNLELPLTSKSFLSGHIVQGHVDGLAKLVDIKKEKNSLILKFSIFSSLTKYIVKKGSIALNGISLTIIDCSKNYFTVGIIPYTFKNTMLKEINIGDYVNVEVDILAKYLEKLTKRI